MTEWIPEMTSLGTSLINQILRTLQMAMFSTNHPSLGLLFQRRRLTKATTHCPKVRKRWTEIIRCSVGDMSQDPWQKEPEAWRQTLKGSQDGVLGPWPSFVMRELKLEIKLEEK